MKQGFIGINRLRIGVDGKGVTTLAAFHGCPLRCKYCLNPHALKGNGVQEQYTPEELFEKFQDGQIYGQETAWPESPLEADVASSQSEPAKIKQVLTSITVAGTSHIKDIDELSEDIYKGVELSMYRDIANKRDPNAIALYLGDNRIGYVPKEKNEILSNLLAAGISLIAVVTESEWRGRWFEIKADIALSD